MDLCILCKEGTPCCFSSCDKCHIGLCDKCKKYYRKLLRNRTQEKIKNCELCKTDFYQFCDYCQNMTLSVMLYDKLNDYKYINELLNNNEKKWSELSEDIKIIIGEPNEYLKTDWIYCDCDDSGHCNRIAQEELKRELGIQHYSLYEYGLDYLLCKPCYLKEFGKEPTIPCD